MIPLGLENCFEKYVHTIWKSCALNDEKSFENGKLCGASIFEKNGAPKGKNGMHCKQVMS